LRHACHGDELGDAGVLVEGVVVEDGVVVVEGVVEDGVVVVDEGVVVVEDGVVVVEGVVEDGVVRDDEEDVGKDVVPVPPPVVEVDPGETEPVDVADVPEREPVVPSGGLASRPLSSKSRSISSCTACTCAAISLGEPPAPELAIPSSFRSAAFSRMLSSCEG
jgi:hypothetical protein